MPGSKRAATAAACALGIAATMTATATPAAAVGTAAAPYHCNFAAPIYANNPDQVWVFDRDATGYLRIETLVGSSVYLTPSVATGTLYWGSVAGVTGMGTHNGVSGRAWLDATGTAPLAGAPTRIDITPVAAGSVTSCYLIGPGSGFPI